jgi:hypothetical protein
MPCGKGWGPAESEEQHRPMIRLKARRAHFFSGEGGLGGAVSRVLDQVPVTESNTSMPGGCRVVLQGRK